MPFTPEALAVIDKTIESIKSEEKMKFDMQFYGRFIFDDENEYGETKNRDLSNSCGTAGCIASHILFNVGFKPTRAGVQYSSEFRDTFLHPVTWVPPKGKYMDEYCCSGVDPETFAGKIIGLDTDLATHLFAPIFRVSYEDELEDDLVDLRKIKPLAAIRILEWLKTQDPDELIWRYKIGFNDIQTQWSLIIQDKAAY